MDQSLEEAGNHTACFGWTGAPDWSACGSAASAVGARFLFTVSVEKIVETLWLVTTEVTAVGTIVTGREVTSVRSTVLHFVIVDSRTSVVAVVVCVDVEGRRVKVAVVVADFVTVDGSGASVGLIV